MASLIYENTGVIVVPSLILGCRFQYVLFRISSAYLDETVAVGGWKCIIDIIAFLRIPFSFFTGRFVVVVVVVRVAHLLKIHAYVG